MSDLKAQRFSFLGLYNGFNFCIQRLDVTDYEYVAPLTLDQVAQLYYNLKQVTLTSSMTACDADAFYCEDFLISPDIFGRYYDPEVPLSQPSSRVCAGGGDGFFWYADNLFAQAELVMEVSTIYELYTSKTTYTFNQFTETYETKIIETTLGYGVPMGFLRAQVGIVALAREGVAYGSFAQSNDPKYIPGTEESWWWLESGDTNFGGVTSSHIDPDAIEIVTLTDIPVSLGPFPFVRASWNAQPANGSWQTTDFDRLKFWEY